MALHHQLLDDRDQDALELALTRLTQLRAREVTDLLPGALVLLGYHALVFRSGGPSRLPPLTQIVFGVAVVCASVSVLMLPLLLGERGARRVRSPRRLLQVKLLAAVSLATLAAALAGDFFVIVATQTGSPDLGATVAAVLVLLIYLPLA